MILVKLTWCYRTTKGVNPTSSSLLFSSLCKQLTSPPEVEDEMEQDDEEKLDSLSSRKKRRINSPCLVSRITSRDCVNIKLALRTIISGFIGHKSQANDDGEDEDDAEDDDSAGAATSTVRLISLLPDLISVH